MALTETGDGDLLGDILVSLVHLIGQFLVGNLNGQANLGGFESLNGALHVRALQNVSNLREHPIRAHDNSPSLRQTRVNVPIETRFMA